MPRRSVHDLLALARSGLDRLTPEQAFEEMGSGAVLVDTRSVDVQDRDGRIPGALGFPLSVLEWRVDPESDSRDPRVGGPGDRLIILCAEGYSSSLAAARLRDLGFERATDVIDGFAGWKAAGLPVEP
jgi:rhodanese-related sulfurtransferase